MVARDTYRWALIKHATTNPDFVAVAFPMPYSKYVLRNDKGPERNLKSYRSKTPSTSTTTSTTSTAVTAATAAAAAGVTKTSSPLTKEVIYSPAELEASKSARTVRWIVDDEPYERVVVAAPTPTPTPTPTHTPQKKPQRSTEVSIRSSRGKRESSQQQQQQQQQQCRPQYKPVRGVSMWFTAV